MDYTFTKLSEVESLPEVPEVATVIAEVDGEIKRIPSNGLGGAGIKTAVIKHVSYDDAINAVIYGGATESSIATVSDNDSGFSCINMTFEEVYEIMSLGEPLDIILMLADGGPTIVHAIGNFAGVQTFDMPAIVIFEPINDLYLFWCAEGVLSEPPMLPK